MIHTQCFLGCDGYYRSFVESPKIPYRGALLKQKFIITDIPLNDIPLNGLSQQ